MSSSTTSTTSGATQSTSSTTAATKQPRATATTTASPAATKTTTAPKPTTATASSSKSGASTSSTAAPASATNPTSPPPPSTSTSTPSIDSTPATATTKATPTAPTKSTPKPPSPRNKKVIPSVTPQVKTVTSPAATLQPTTQVTTTTTTEASHASNPSPIPPTTSSKDHSRRASMSDQHAKEGSSKEKDATVATKPAVILTKDLLKGSFIVDGPHTTTQPAQLKKAKAVTPAGPIKHANPAGTPPQSQTVKPKKVATTTTTTAADSKSKPTTVAEPVKKPAPAARSAATKAKQLEKEKADKIAAEKAERERLEKEAADRAAAEKAAAAEKLAREKQEAAARAAAAAKAAKEAAAEAERLAAEAKAAAEAEAQAAAAEKERQEAEERKAKEDAAALAAQVAARLAAAKTIAQEEEERKQKEREKEKEKRVVKSGNKKATPTPASTSAATKPASSKPATKPVAGTLPVISPRNQLVTKPTEEPAKEKPASKLKSDIGQKRATATKEKDKPEQQPKSQLASPRKAEPSPPTPVIEVVAPTPVEEKKVEPEPAVEPAESETLETIAVPVVDASPKPIRPSGIPIPAASTVITSPSLAPSPAITPKKAPMKSLLQQPSPSLTSLSGAKGLELAKERNAATVEQKEREARAAAAALAEKEAADRAAAEQERQLQMQQEKEKSRGARKPHGASKSKKQRQASLEMKEIDDTGSVGSGDEPVIKSRHPKKKLSISSSDSSDAPPATQTQKPSRPEKKDRKHHRSQDLDSSAAPSATVPPALNPVSLSALKQSLTLPPSTGKNVMQDLLLEYFESRGLRRTIASFQQEQGETTARVLSAHSQSPGATGGLVTPRGTQSKAPKPGIHSSPQLKKLNLVARLRRSFDIGDRSTFFSLLSTEAPDAVRTLKRDLKGESLLFWFHLYFAVYPIHPHTLKRASLNLSEANLNPTRHYSEEAAKNMGDFQRYLSSAATSDPTILPYFGLPYVENPQTHATFSHLFEQQWLEEMQQKAEKFITSQLHTSNKSSSNLMMSGSTSSLDDVTPSGRRPGPATRLEKLVLGAVNAPQQQQQSSSTTTAGEKKKRTVVRRPLPGTKSPARSRGVSPVPTTPNRNRNNDVTVTDLNSPPTSVSAPFHSSSGSPTPASSPPKPRVPPPPGISIQDVSRKDLHDALSIANKLNNLLNLLQMDIASSNEGGPESHALSDADLQDLQHKLQNLATKSVILQTKKAPPPAVTSGSVAGATSTDGSFVRSASSAAIRQSSTDLSSVSSGPAYFAWPALNFLAITEHLKDRHVSSEEKAKLLQALRWRLTRSTHAVKKRHLALFVSQDLLQCKVNGTAGGSLLHVLASDPVTQEQTARLINVMSSYSAGRSYLLHHSGLIPLLFSILKSHSKNDNASRQHALGSLQKFSLSRRAQSTMIHLGVMEWCAESILALATINESHTGRPLSDYSLEYGTALLMNLSLRTAGKLRAEQQCSSSSSNPTDILPALLSCIRLDDLQFRTYINGSLYSLLSRRKIRQQARRLNLKTLLLNVRPTVDQRVQQQFDYILRLLSSHEESDAESATSPAPAEASTLSDDEDDFESDEKENAMESSSTLLDSATRDDDGEDLTDQDTVNEDEEVVADADDDEAAAAAASTQADSQAGENFLQTFYNPLVQEETAAYAAVPVNKSGHVHTTSSLHQPLSSVPYPLPSSPVQPTHLINNNPTLNTSASQDKLDGRSSVQQRLALPSLDVDLTPNQTPRNSSPLPGSSAYFAHASPLSRGPPSANHHTSFPILKPTTPSSHGRHHSQFANAFNNYPPTSTATGVTTAQQSVMIMNSRGGPVSNVIGGHVSSIRGVNLHQPLPQSQQQRPYPGNQQQQQFQATGSRGLGKSPSAPVLNPHHHLPSSLGPHHQSPPPSLQPRKLGPSGGSTSTTPVPPLPLVGERRIPPPSQVNDPTEKESLTRYYKAFATRAKVGRTPISSAFAEPGEFER